MNFYTSNVLVPGKVSITVPKKIFPLFGWTEFLTGELAICMSCFESYCGRSEKQEHNSASMKNIGNSLLTMCEVRMRGNIFICQEKYWWPSWKILSGNMSHTAALWHHLTSHIYVFSFKPHPDLWQCYQSV